MMIFEGEYEKILKYYENTHEKFFEFELNYVNKESPIFTEIERFIWESKHSVRFKNEYSGAALVDLSQWNDKMKTEEQNQYFKAFLYYLKSREGSIDVSFHVNKKLVQSLEELLISIFGEVKTKQIGKVEHEEETRQIGFVVEEKKKEKSRYV